MRRKCCVVASMAVLSLFFSVCEAASESSSAAAATASAASIPETKTSAPIAQRSAGSAGKETAPVKSGDAQAGGSPIGGKGTNANQGGGGPTGGTDQQKANYDGAAKVLFVAFAVALFLESALAAIFNWRPFVQTFVRGTRTVVSFVVSLLLVVLEPRLEVFSQLIEAMFGKPAPELGFVGTVLSALMFAGGSSGFNTLLVALGFRSMRTPESVVPRPKRTEAWVSVRLARKPEAPARVMMTTGAGAPHVIGIIDGSSPHLAWLRYFVRDKGRFPNSGGFAVASDQTYSFAVETMQNGVPFTLGPWGPLPIAAGAIVDIVFD